MNVNHEELIGQMFHKLTVVKYIGHLIKDGTKNKKHYYLCKCECGNFIEVSKINLKRIKSCGCSRRYKNAENAKNRGISQSNKSGKTGIHLNKETNKWVAGITVNYETIYLGAYAYFKEAVKARIEAEKKHGFTCDDIYPD